MADFRFEIIAKDMNCRARAGVIKTRHGEIETPYLVPVATSASVRGMDCDALERIGVQCVLANTYHLHFQPGDKLIGKFGGLHKFMSWRKPIFTDSGGFQAFSLGLGALHGTKKIGFIPQNKEVKEEKKEEELLAKVSDKGVEFRSAYDGAISFLTPKDSMEIQSNLGADIIMAFDECTSQRSKKEYVKKSVERTHRWAIESLKYHDKKQALYGIIQGGFFKDLREESTKFIMKQGFDGIAIGGALGETKKDMKDVLSWIMGILQDDARPRHMLGIGWVDDLFECVENGLDTFDCVHMTRLARHGGLYVASGEGNMKNKFKIEINKAKYSEDKKPIDSTCDCPTCKKYSRAYLHHLYKAKEISYYTLATTHNVYFMLSLAKKIRGAIIKGNFKELKKEW